jgi:hypothetical protein
MPERLRRLRLQLLVRALCACLWLGACEADNQVSEAGFELHTSAGCELGDPEHLDLFALGDFPAKHASFELRDSAESFDTFPIDTRELAIQGRFAADVSASGRASLPAAQSGSGSAAPRSIVVLPDGRSCPLSDFGIVAREGAMVAALPQGGLFIAGGTGSDGSVLSTALTVAAGALIGELVPDGMLLRRRYATATLAGSWIVVAGGSEDARGGAAESYEVFDPAAGRFAGALSRKLAHARMEHGAALLPDGSVLLAGGRSEPGGAPLASAELIRLEPPAPEQPGDLVTARTAPSVLVLDSGAVIVAGGRDEAGEVVNSLERFEAADEHFVPLGLELPTYENVVALALPGARVAWLGCDTRSHSCGLTLVLLRGDEPVQVDVSLDWQGIVPLGLSSLRAIALDDGRLLVTGRDPDANMMSRALVIDLDARAIDSAEASRAPSVLVALADGAIAELDPFGTSLRNLGSFSVYESPTDNLLAAEVRRVTIDAPERWKRSDEGLRALVTGARADIPHLQLGNFELELRLDGAALVRIATADLPDLSIGVGASVSAAGCPQLTASGRIVLERRPGVVAVKLGPNGKDECTVQLPSSRPAKVAIEAEADTLLRELRVTRR